MSNPVEKNRTNKQNSRPEKSVYDKNNREITPPITPDKDGDYDNKGRPNSPFK